MKRLVCGMLFGLILTAGLAPAKEKPNILFIFADDQCYATLSALGNPEVHTPNLDRLAGGGMLFTHAYNMGSWSGAVCMPSRVMLNTGRFLWNAKAASVGIAERGGLWSQRMSRAGYRTYMTGKWHVVENGSWKRPIKPAGVFDVTGKVRGGMPAQTQEGYNRPRDENDKTWLPWDTKRGGFWEGGTHWSEVLADETVSFIEKASKEDLPFFIYAAFNAPHDPRQSPRRFVEMYPADKIAVPENFLPLYPHRNAIGCSDKLRDEKLAPFPRTEYAVRVNRQEYYAIITHMDEQIGRILDTLEASGEAGNTWIFFTADHGLACGQHGLMGKQNLYDHSVRVPFLAKGPGVKAGSRCVTPIYLQDVMATSLELARAGLDGVEFKSLLPLLRGGSRDLHGDIYGAYLDLQRMITRSGYKLLYYPKAQVYRLFNLADDPHEKNDLADQPGQAARLEEMKAALKDLQLRMNDPLVKNK